jgi:hypothetical protein
MKQILLSMVFLMIQALLFGQESQNKIPINAKLPFGCDLLVKFKFPYEYKYEYDDTINKDPISKAYVDLRNCFRKLNNSKAILKLPKINQLEYIKVGDYEDWKFDTKLLNSFDSSQYRLPNFGIYECYYSYNFRNYDNKGHNAVRSFCEDAGNIIFYNPKNYNAKILNVYISLLGDFEGLSRYFYIHKNKEIQIFEGVSDESIIRMKKKYIISVLKNGEIKIDEIK